MTLGDGILWSSMLILLSGCGNKEEPPVRGVSDAENFSELDSECYEQVLELEIQNGEETLAELIAATENDTLMEYFVTSHVRDAEFDLEICRRYTQCYEIPDDERSMHVVSCINQRVRERDDMAEY